MRVGAARLHRSRTSSWERPDDQDVAPAPRRRRSSPGVDLPPPPAGRHTPPPAHRAAGATRRGAAVPLRHRCRARPPQRAAGDAADRARGPARGPVAGEPTIQGTATARARRLATPADGDRAARRPRRRAARGEPGAAEPQRTARTGRPPRPAAPLRLRDRREPPGQGAVRRHAVRGAHGPGGPGGTGGLRRRRRPATEPGVRPDPRRPGLQTVDGRPHRPARAHRPRPLVRRRLARIAGRRWWWWWWKRRRRGRPARDRRPAPTTHPALGPLLRGPPSAASPSCFGDPRDRIGADSVP